MVLDAVLVMMMLMIATSSPASSPPNSPHPRASHSAPAATYACPCCPGLLPQELSVEEFPEAEAALKAFLEVLEEVLVQLCTLPEYRHVSLAKTALSGTVGRTAWPAPCVVGIL